MKPNYGQALYDDFIHCAKALPVDADIFHVKDIYDNDSIIKQFSNGVRKPLIDINTTGFEYVKNRIVKGYMTVDTDGNSTENSFDYFNSMPVELHPNIQIISFDILQLSELEEYVLSLFESPHRLSIPSPVDPEKNIVFEISCRKDNIIRKSTDKFSRPLYVTAIYLIGTVCVSFAEKYSAARLALDKNVTSEIIERLAALEDIRTLFAADAASAAEETIKSIDAAWKQHNRIIDNFAGEITYHELWEEICETKSTPEDAIKQLLAKKEAEKHAAEEKKKKAEEAQRREEQRRQNAEKNFRKKGDTAINRLTDAVVADIQAKISNDDSWRVYGGSTYTEWYRLEGTCALEYPNILVHTLSNFTFENKTYTNVTASGEPVTHRYALNALPIQYGVRMEIMAKSREAVEEMSNRLYQLYGDEVTVRLADPVWDGELISIKLEYDTNQPSDAKTTIDRKDGSTVYHAFAATKRYPSVYHPIRYAFTDLVDNQRLQVRLLQQAEFLIICDSKIRDIAMPKLDGQYKPLLNMSQRRSLFGSLSDAVGSVFDSEDYKKLKACFKNRMPIDRNLFDRALIDITNVYPLYDKMMQGWTVDQIRDDMKRYSDYFNREWNEICNNLAAAACPLIFPQLGMSDNTNLPTMRIRKGLIFYIEKMANNPYCSLSEAKSAYDNQLEQERREEEQRQLEAEEERQRRLEQKESGQYGQPSSGGFFRSMLSTAGGVALGNKLSDNRSGKDGKKDLFGTGACPYGKKDEHGWSIRCDMRCPFNSNCKGHP